MVNDPPIKVGDIISVAGITYDGNFVAKAVKITPTEGVLLDRAGANWTIALAHCHHATQAEKREYFKLMLSYEE